MLSDLDNLVKSTPQEHGYIRSRWSSELLALVLGERVNVTVHATSMLHAQRGRIVCVEHERKNPVPFIHLLYQLKRTYRRARRIVLIDDQLFSWGRRGNSRNRPLRCTNVYADP